MEEQNESGFRRNNKTTLILQIVFDVICAPVAIFGLMLLISALTAKGDVGAAVGAVFGTMLLIIDLIAAGVLLIPFILLLVFCSKPWIAVAGYAITAIIIIAAFIAYINIGQTAAAVIGAVWRLI